MRLSQPKSTAEAAFDEVIALMNRRFVELDQFAAARLERAARAGIGNDPEHAYQTLGIVAASKWDVEGMHSNFEHATRYASNGAIYVNYATSLNCTARLLEGAEQAEAAAQREPTNLAYLRIAIDSNWNAGRWARALELQEQYRKRKMDEMPLEFSYHERAFRTAERNGVKFEAIEQLHTALFRFLSERHVRWLGAQAFIDSAPGEEAIYVTALVPGDANEVRKLDEELTSVLFDAVEEFPLGAFSIELGPEIAPNDA
ncbi:MAG: hypothetical protein AB1704_33100 [Pseudomonadota bacterium]|jgi:hypothetical protein|uniref:hypothetical protein n=1 Tax=Burkholderiaceae TaxID=119060 RepID=UPI0010FA3738|nr:hypothetical protein [Burkholderia sp. 4M9327F10]